MLRENTCLLLRLLAAEHEEKLHTIVAAGAEYKKRFWKIKLAGLITLGIAPLMLLLYSSIFSSEGLKAGLKFLTASTVSIFPWRAALFGLALVLCQIIISYAMVKR